MVSREDVARVRDILRTVAAGDDPTRNGRHGRSIVAGLSIAADRLDELLGEDTRPDAERAS